MKRVRILLLFILFFLVGGGTAYAQSVEDKAPGDQPKIQQEAVSTPRENKIETSQTRDTATKKESAEPVQEKSVLETKEPGEDKEQGEAAEVKEATGEEVKTPEAEKTEAETEPSPEEQQALDEEKPEAEPAKETVNPEEIENQDKAKEELKEEAKKDEVKVEGDVKEASQEGEVLEKGTVLDPQVLKANTSAEETNTNVKEVNTFEDLKAAIESVASGEKKTIVVKQSIEITGTIKIPAGADIILISSNEKTADGQWEPIEQPKDHAKEGEEKQREVIEDAKERGDQAIKDAEENITEKEGEYYYTFEEGEIVLKRFESFTGSLFEVKGSLTLGDANHSINLDGNKKKVKASGGNNGSFFNVNGGTLVLNNGVIANGQTSGNDYNSPIRVKENGTFIMNGGRITANKTKASYILPYNAGAVDVSRGGHFIMNNGMIDHNISASGAVFVGNDGLNNTKILNEDKDFALFEFKGGSIVSNKSKGYNLAGGITIFPTGKLNITDGIVANNYAGNKAGGIMVSDQYVRSFSNSINNSYSKTHDEDYDKYVQKNKAEANFDGGLIYKNETGYAGGGVFVDSNHVHFNKTMILDNKAAKFGGGVYVGFPPRVQELENILITENETYKSGMITTNDDAWGGPLVGGGIWNCPDGYIHLGDGHSVYVFNNKGAMGGADYVFAKKTYNFELNGTDIHNQFYTFISPSPKKNTLLSL